MEADLVGGANGSKGKVASGVLLGEAVFYGLGIDGEGVAAGG